MRVGLLILTLWAAPQEWTELKMGDEAVKVYRDSWGVPHIFAKSVQGAFWGEGYTEAQDRLWQMEKFRRVARGQAAELFGESELPSDVEYYRNGYTESELRRMFESSSERLKSILTAYTAGVNAFLKTGKRPPEYAALKQEPRPWEEIDCIAIGVLMARRFGDSGGVELFLQTVYHLFEKQYGADKAKVIFHDLLRPGDPRAPTTIGDEASPGSGPPSPPKDEGRPFVPIDPEWARARLSELAQARAAREALGVPTYAGSNAWVLGPKKTASGQPILYGGPMMGFKTPSICNEIHLAAPDLNVAGMSFPGVPGVMIGFNERIAWTTTSGGADLVDVYQIELHPEKDDEYRWKGEWRKLETIEVEIKVAGQEPRKEVIRRSRYGPLMGPLDLKRRTAYTAAMPFWMKEQSSFEAVLDFNFASNLDEFRTSVPKVVTSHNFFVADREGRIGFWFCGAHPKRKQGHDPRLPQKGDGSMDWEGILPFEAWPQSVDPPRGFFANWNNKPTRTWEPSPFGKIFWGKKIIDVLSQDRAFTLDEAADLARATAYHDYLADYFVPHIVAAAKEEKDENVKKAVALLEAWDHMKRDGAPEPAIMERWFRKMIAKIFGNELGLILMEKEVQRMLMDPLLYLLESDGTLKYDFADGRDLRALAVESLKDVVKDGPDKLAWKEGEIRFKGRPFTVKSERGRGTYQLTVELLKDGPRAVSVAAPGQSEDPQSPHFADQMKLFEAWKYKEFVFRRSEMK
ncbi:MAG: penicillin acylase family protein [Planctomycetes bacterium]|nr:penicillin acylase family protein [Planctomycetota bacterium]